MRPPESFIGQPVRSLQTMLRVIAEDDPSLPTVIPDGIYGQTTIGAVTEFQRKYDLPITGITDQRTWELIVEQYEAARIQVDPAAPIEILLQPGQILVPGDQGANIFLLQSMLIYLSQDHPLIPAPEHNGLFDIKTADALRAFQLLAGLPPTGNLDKITWKHLTSHFSLNAHHNDSNSLNFSIKL